MPMDEVAIPESFTLLSVPLPPMLPALVGHNGISRFFSLCYFGTKATWSTGWGSSTFSFYAAYQPLIEHPALAFSLADRNLGSDDDLPEDALLADRQTARLYVGPYEEVETFMRTHNTPPPALSAEEIAAAQRYLEAMPTEEMREQGIFEFLFGPTPAQRKGGGELVAWLDQFITAEMLASFRRAAGAGNPYAVYLLRELEQRAARQADRDAPWIELE